ncbi:MAG: hypothetical protein HQ518_05810 [Rhodopirellula sp.]|nr:hypothetical protein [Rhodopirellula sp.]
MSDTQPEPDNASDQHKTSSPVAAMLEQAVRALREAEPAAFLVQARVLRRVIKQEWELPALTVQVPHRKSRIISRNTVIRYVDWDELGLEANADLPDRAILIARPDDKHLESMSLGQLKLQIWRLLFHSKIHDVFDQLQSNGILKAGDFRQRIDQLGQVEFDEIHSVLKRENFIPANTSSADVFIEFAAVYSELRCFAPHCLRSYFPSFSDYKAVDRLLRQDIDVEELFLSTRLEGSPDPEIPDRDEAHDETDEELETLTGRGSTAHVFHERTFSEPDDARFPSLLDAVMSKVESAKRPNLATFGRLIRRADKAFARGNAVAAALHQMRAAKYATPELVSEAVSGALTDLQRLVRRLQNALNFDQPAARSWYESLVGLLLQAGLGFWNADKRLLYDLQKVCVDHEKEIYTVDLLGYATSFGRRPIKRALPNQREVLMSKHLRSATRRLVTSRLTGQEHRRLSRLLHEAAHSSEHQMRTRLRPLVESTLEEVDLTPQNIPERIAFGKLVEELLDGVANRGFLTMGDLRDAISRSNLKISDLSGPKEFFLGDKLLQADGQLSRVLDGVYQRGDIYLRWLQRLSAVCFGTVCGRFSTRFIFIPYGLAYLAFEAIVHIVELFNPPATEEVIDAATGVATTIHGASSPVILAAKQNMPAIIFALGTLLLLIIHVAPFRQFLKKTCASIFSGLRRAFYEWPVRFLRLSAVRRFLKSATVRLIRKFLIWPAIPTALVCSALPRLYPQIPEQPWTNWGIVLAAMSVILNSRVGRDVEELSAEWLHSTWTRIRVHVFVALFDLVMDFFKRLLEGFDRILYAVDEWLRFKSGETTLSLGAKAILGVFWAGFTFVARFCVNLLIEPQINPIKHFPVVTVSHKIILPLGLPGGLLSKLLQPLFGVHSDAVAINTVFLIPGIFGFMAWELKSNWQLYKANRGENLKPVLVGNHGETFIRLMKPGFHSGTLPKLFLRLRRIDRHRSPTEHSLARSKYLDHLHHVHVAVEHFVVRELLQLLKEAPGWNIDDISVSRIRLASNNIRIELACPSRSADTLMMVFEEQSGWLVANTLQTGWVQQLDETRQDILLSALVGFYKLAGVDMVREQIAASFAPRRIPYDVMEDGLVLWPDGEYAEEAVYNLWHHQIIRPYPRAVARNFLLPTLTTESLLFVKTPLAWDVWAARWDNSQGVKPAVLPDNIRWSWPVADSEDSFDEPA